MDFKKQHFVPKSYLMSWCDKKSPKEQSAYLWMYSSDGSKVKRKSPKNIFYKNDFYTIYDDDGSRILDVEHGLSGIENRFAAIRDKKINKGKLLSRVEMDYILYFVAAMNNRTVASRNHFEGEWKKVIDLGDKLKEEILKIPFEKRQNMTFPGSISEGKSRSLTEMKEIRDNPVEQLMLPRIRVEFQQYRKMHASFFITEDDVGFITSDNPCVWFDPDSYKRPAMYQSLGLGYPNIEVTMPISPKVTIIISHHKLPLYIHVEKASVDSMNRKTRFNAKEYYIVNQEHNNKFWFKVLTPPK